MSASYDAVVVGSGHNGLVAAIVLARAGWDVQVVEANERPGGALASADLTLPSYMHDLYATNLNLLLASPFYAQFGIDLQRHGLKLRRSEHAFANVFPDGRSVGVGGGLEQTLVSLGNLDPRDARGWREMYELFQRTSGLLFSAYAAPVPSLARARARASAGRRLGRHGLAEVLQLVASSCRELVDTYLVSDEAKVLVASWGLHLDFGPDIAGGAMFPLLEAMADMENGITIAEGGASRVVDALCGLLGEYGGKLRLGTAVRDILIDKGRAVGVELDSGERLSARRAVVANVSPTALVRDLLDPGCLPARERRALDRYSYGPATMMIHLALAGPVPWAAGELLQRFAYVHVAPYLDDLARTYADALAGRLPEEPLLVVGQTSSVDPTRAPGDGQVLWIQVRALPTTIEKDPHGQLSGATWDAAREVFADRVMAKLERYAPGLSKVVLGRTVLSPSDLERQNRNLVGGDSIAGSMHLRQNFLLRPGLGMARSHLPLMGLRLVGAGVWPGPGLNALSGHHAARDLVRESRGYGLPAALWRRLSMRSVNDG
ncbi:MAG: phytoene desaturase family protein [Acidimicrobiales bacterium]